MSDKAIHPMKICMVGDSRSIHFRRWTEMLQSRGHEIIALVPNPVENLSAEQYSIEPSHPIPFVRTFQRILKTRQWVKKLQPDLVIGQYMAPYGWCAALSGGKLRTVMGWGSDISPLVKRTFFDNTMNRMTISRFDFVIAWSNFLGDAFKRFGAKEDKIIRVNFPPSTMPPASDCPCFDDVFAPLSLISGRYLVSIRGMSPVYNQETIVRAIPEMIKFAPDIKVVFLCYGVDKDYLNRIKNLVSELSVEKSTLFIEGQPLDRFAVLCRNALATITMSKSDGMPLSVLEVLSLGVPLIAGRIPPIEEILKDGVNGFVVDLFDSIRLANSIQKLHSEPNIRSLFEKYNQSMIAEFNKPDKGFIKVEELMN